MNSSKKYLDIDGDIIQIKSTKCFECGIIKNNQTEHFYYCSSWKLKKNNINNHIKKFQNKIDNDSMKDYILVNSNTINNSDLDEWIDILAISNN